MTFEGMYRGPQRARLRFPRTGRDRDGFVYPSVSLTRGSNPAAGEACPLNER